jgi:hypothetical protein
MKKLVLTTVASLACLAAFAQGRISFQTDSLHLVYYDPSESLGGSAPSATNMPPGANLVADLYMGTSSSTLFLYSTTTFGATSGKWNTLNVQANANATTGATAIPGGTTVFVFAQIRDSAFPAPNTWTPGSGPVDTTWYGGSGEFSFILGTSTLAYPPMYAPGASLGGGFSTWAQGTYPMDFVSAGFRGAIMVGTIVPEPSSFALAGLGAAAMVLFRRRK